MKILVTGGLGLVGANYAEHCLNRGDVVVVLDNWARGQGSRLNAEWLRSLVGGPQLHLLHGSVAREEDVLSAIDALGGVDVVLHAAAQSSVDVSMTHPDLDFRWNVVGTFTVLDTIRRQSPEARVIYFASNKVYDTTAWPVEIQGLHYRWVGRRVGPSEAYPFYTDAKEPYGASKIAGFYYCRAYAALYGMPIIIAVPSGMYGPRQFGRTEQGWLGWFAIASELGLPIEIRGDGFQVRDMLHVDDVCSAVDLLVELAPKYKGEVFNLGGGPANAPSLIEAITLIAGSLGKTASLRYTDWRPQDNKVYISNCERIIGQGWHPKIGIREGVEDLCRWVRTCRDDLLKVYA